MRGSLAVFLMFLIQLPVSSQAIEINNLEDIIKSIEASKFYSKTAKRKIRIAVFDKGFAGYQDSIGKTLPQNTEFVPGAQPENTVDTVHGTAMAEILYGVISNQGRSFQNDIELFLVNAKGYTNFKSAVEFAISKNIDLVLYSEVWDYGNNFDGKGFLNQEVDRFIGSGGLWINASGNFGQTTINVKPKFLDNSRLVFPDRKSKFRFSCKPFKKQKAQECQVRFVLSWSDYPQDVSEGVSSDLDFGVYDELGEIVESSLLRQRRKATEASPVQPGESTLPREIIETTLQPGEYFIRVLKRSDKFSAENIRISGFGDGLVFSSYDRKESINHPADNPKVITVGALDYSGTSVSRTLSKPEVALPSVVDAEEGAFTGSSNSAAIAAALVGLKMMTSKSLPNRAQAIDGLQSLSGERVRGPRSNYQDVTSERFTPAFNQPCFRRARSAIQMTETHEGFLESVRGEVVYTNYGLAILVGAELDRLFGSLDLKVNEVPTYDGYGGVIKLSLSQVGRVAGVLPVFQSEIHNICRK
jgi:hypothetical protein